MCVFLVSACTKPSEKTLKCSLYNKDVISNYELDSTYEVTYKGNVVSKVKSIETVISNDSEILDYFNEYLNSSYTTMNENYGGYDFTVEKQDEKVIATTIIDYNKLDLNKLAKDQPTFKSSLDSKGNLTLTGIKQLYSELGVTCE
jgi:hypothetical protein